MDYLHCGPDGGWDTAFRGGTPFRDGAVRAIRQTYPRRMAIDSSSNDGVVAPVSPRTAAHTLAAVSSVPGLEMLGAAGAQLEWLRGDRVVVLDGGLGTHLADRGNDVSDSLWSARILRDNPDEVRAAHEDFFRAGAEVASTCSYQVTFDGLAQVGASREETEKLLRASVRLAHEAAEAVPEVHEVSVGEGLSSETESPRLVAASIGPYGAGPGQGTEYDGAYGLTAAELAAWHRPRLEILADTDANFLLAETIPSILEVEALTSEFARFEKPAILSITVADGKLRDGSSLEDVAAIVRGSRLAGLGINCCTTADALTALRTLTPLNGLAMAVYPNSGESWDRVARQWAGNQNELSLVGSVSELIEAGARMIGGCCRVTPQHIAAIAAQLR